MTETHDHPLGPDAPPRYIDSQGRVCYRASSLGRCDRALVAAARGEHARPYPVEFQAILDEGKRMEPVIVAKWEAEHAEQGYVVANAQRRVELEVMENVFIVGHIDGEFYNNFHNCLFEAKKIRESGWQDFIRRGVEWLPAYPWQMAFYMHGLDCDDLAFVGGRYDAENDDISETYTHWLTAPPLPLKALVKKIRELERVIGAGFAASEVKCNKADYPCPYVDLHDEDESADKSSVGEGAELFIVPEGAEHDWHKAVAKLEVMDAEIRVLKNTLGTKAKARDEKVDELRKLIASMGGDAAKEVRTKDGKSAVKRVRYHRKEYTVKATEVDYFKFGNSKDKDEES